MKSLTKYVVFSIAVLLIYTAIDIIVTALTNVDLGTLTTCIFATFGGDGDAEMMFNKVKSLPMKSDEFKEAENEQ